MSGENSFGDSFEDNEISTVSTNPHLSTELSSSVTPQPLPTEIGAVTTPPSIPQENKIDQVINRYTGALESVKPAEEAVQSAQEKRDNAYQRYMTQSTKDNEEFKTHPKSGVANIARHIGSQINYGIWQRAEGNLGKKEDQLENIQVNQAQALGGEALANSSMESIKHATSSQRLETLIDANRQSPIEDASQTFTSSLDKQDELAKQLKEEAQRESEQRQRENEQRQREVFISTQISHVEAFNKSMDPEVRLSINPEIIAFCSEKALKGEKLLDLPVEKTSFDLSLEHPTNQFEANLYSLKIEKMRELESKFYTPLAFLSAAERDAKSRGETLNLEKFKEIYENSKRIIANNKRDEYGLVDLSIGYHKQWIGENIASGQADYPHGILAQFLEITHPFSGPDKLTEEEIKYGAYAYACAFLESETTSHVDTKNFLLGMALIERKGSFEEYTDYYDWNQRYPGINTTAKELGMKYKNIMTGMMAGGLTNKRQHLRETQDYLIRYMY